MTYQSVWYHTEIPRHLIDTIEKDINDCHLDMQLQDAAIGHHEMINSYRNSKVSFIPPSHWIVGFCYNYILQANRDNFQYDIAGFEDNNMQYTVYNPGEYYHWHFDDDNVSDTIIKNCHSVCNYLKKIRILEETYNSYLLKTNYIMLLKREGL